MIDQINQVNTSRGGFSPLKPKPIFTLDSLAFLFFNVLSAGLYGAVQSALNERSISRLDLCQENLKKTAAALLVEYNKLDGEISGLRASVMRGEEINADNIDRLQANAAALPSKQEGILHAQNQLVQAVALSAIQMISALLFNVLTIGLYGVYQNHLQLAKIENAEAKNNHIGEEIRLKIESYSLRLQNDIQELRAADSLNREEKEALRSEKGQAYQALKSAEKEMEGIHHQIQAFNNQLLALRTNQMTLREGTALLTNSFAALDAQRVELEIAFQNLKDAHQILPKAQMDELKRIGALVDAQKQELTALILSRTNAEMQLLGINQTLGAAEKEQLKLGPIPPKYVKRADDFEVTGAYGLEDHENDAALLSAFARCNNGKKTAAEVVKANLDAAIEQLLLLGGKADPKIHFNKSAMIYSDEKFSENRDAVYRYMAHEFIVNGKLFQDGCGGFSLKLNQDGVCMGSSRPERVQSYQIESITGERRSRELILPTHIDEFTPAIGDRDLLFGIDPASAKWIYARLNNEEKSHLYHLLMDSLIANEDAGLIAAKNFMRGNSERVKLVDNAYTLICSIATALDKKFAKNVFSSWGELDEWDEPYPFEKPAVRVEGPVNHSNVIVEWKPDYDCIKGKREDGAFSRSGFGSAIENSVKRYKKIYAGMTAEAVNNPNRILYPASISDKTIGKIQIKGLKEQFKDHHLMLGNQGCLISNITGILMTDPLQADERNAKKLKEAMADFLGKSVHSEEFENKIKADHKGTTVTQYFTKKIQSTHNTSLLQYRKWLKGESGGASISNSNLGDLEIEIVAHLIGAKIAVFYEGMSTKLNEFGLTVPEIICYGPNTKETFFLYNCTNSTYYSLWPKLNPEAFANNEARQASIEVNNYVARIN